MNIFTKFCILLPPTLSSDRYINFFRNIFKLSLHLQHLSFLPYFARTFYRETLWANVSSVMHSLYMNYIKNSCLKVYTQGPHKDTNYEHRIETIS